MVTIRPATVTGAAASTVPALAEVSATSATCPTPKKGKGKKGSASKRKGKRKRPRQVLSAGGFSSPPPGSGNPFVVYVDSRAGTGAWLATAVNGSVFSPSGTVLVTSQGICV
jgi:hypothetical protein